MTDRKALSDANETPEDVATLYSWANLHGAKYRDFSASRAQTREKARQRMEDAIVEERRRVCDEAEIAKQLEARQAAEVAQAAEAERKEKFAAEVARHQAEQAERGWLRSKLDRLHAVAASNPVPPGAPQSKQTEYPSYVWPQQANRTAPPAFGGASEEPLVVSRTPWAHPELRENPGGGAWLAADRSDTGLFPKRLAPEDTLEGAGDRMASRWFALKGVFDATAVPSRSTPSPASAQVPVMAVFSLAGGVGKTSLVATLGRALCARGEQVLLVDTTAYGLLPFFFGAQDQRPGMLRTFSPPGGSGDAPIQMFTADPQSLGPANAPQESLTTEIGKYARSGVSRVIVDLATASDATTRHILRMNPMILVPVIPDMNSVVSVSSIDAFFQHHGAAGGSSVTPYYVLNKFDPSLALHLDVREVLRERLGDRLLRFALRRTPAISEALAEGMTVMDYAPNSTGAEDFGVLAEWVKSVSAPAPPGYRGARWSEQ